MNSSVLNIQTGMIIRFQLLGVIFLCFLAVFSCKNEEVAEPLRCCTKLKVLNLAERSSVVDVISLYYNTSNRIITNFSPKAVFPKQGFLAMDGIDVPIGNNSHTKLRWQVVPKGQIPTKRNIMADTSLLFEKDKNYLVFMSDESKNKPVFSVINENNNPRKLEPDRVYFRVVELIPNRQNIILIESSSTLTKTGDIKFGEISEYSSFWTKDQFYEYVFEAKIFIENKSFVKTDRIKLERGKSYTFYLYKDVNGINKIGYFED